MASSTGAAEMSGDQGPGTSPGAAEPSKSQRELEDEVFKLCCRHVQTLVGRSSPEFSDLVQGSAEMALRGLPSFEGRSSLSTWVFRVCYSTLLGERRWYKRWAKRFSLAAPQELPEIASTEDASQPLEWREREQCVRDAVSKLRPKLQVVVTMHDLQGVEIQAIADLLEVNVLTVRSRLRDGRRQLSRRLRRDPYFGIAACSSPGGGRHE